VYTHSYKKKTGKQFQDFIRDIDPRCVCNSSSIKQIFLILYNMFIHRSKKVRKTIQKSHLQKSTIFKNPLSRTTTPPDRSKMDIVTSAGRGKQFYV
jgi:hypothetical protein